jgi:hypothetical protein
MSDWRELLTEAEKAELADAHLNAMVYDVGILKYVQTPDGEIEVFSISGQEIGGDDTNKQTVYVDFNFYDPRKP